MNSRTIMLTAALMSATVLAGQPKPDPPPLGYIAVVFVYHSGKLTSAAIMGQSPTMQTCLKAAQGVVAEIIGGNKDSKTSFNAGCMPIPTPVEVL